MDVEGGEGEEAPLWGPDDPEIYDDCEEVEGPEAGCVFPSLSDQLIVPHCHH